MLFLCEIIIVSIVKCSIYSGGSKMSGRGTMPTKPVASRRGRNQKRRVPRIIAECAAVASKHSLAILRVDG